MSRLHVPLTDRAAAGLHAAMELSGDDEVAVVQAALVVYAELSRLGEHDGTYDAEVEVGRRRLYLTTCRTPHERRSPW